MTDDAAQRRDSIRPSTVAIPVTQTYANSSDTRAIVAIE